MGQNEEFNKEEEEEKKQEKGENEEKSEGREHLALSAGPTGRWLPQDGHKNFRDLFLAFTAPAASPRRQGGERRGR